MFVCMYARVSMYVSLSIRAIVKVLIITNNIKQRLKLHHMSISDLFIES